MVADTYCLHPDYESSTLQNNLGLIQFREPVKDVEYVRPAYLPTEPLDPESIYVAVSWGSFTSGNGNDLNYATVTIVPNDECMVKSDSLACGVSEDDEGLCWVRYFLVTMCVIIITCVIFKGYYGQCHAYCA